MDHTRADVKRKHKSLEQTPASCASSSKNQDEKDPHPRYFSIFNRHKKTVHLIRHGHTTYTEAHFKTKLGNSPFDVTLSTLGIQQAIDLKARLFNLEAELILTSPLTRALQTLQHALNFTQGMGALRVEVSDLHTEHVHNSGDVGRPASILSNEFPWISFSGLKDVWWFSPQGAPNDPIEGIFQSEESMDHLRKRVGIFRQFILSRPENVIAVIGHSTFFRELSGKRQRMKNCEILTMQV